MRSGRGSSTLLRQGRGPRSPSPCPLSSTPFDGFPPRDRGRGRGPVCVPTLSHRHVESGLSHPGSLPGLPRPGREGSGRCLCNSNKNTPLSPYSGVRTPTGRWDHSRVSHLDYLISHPHPHCPVQCILPRGKLVPPTPCTPQGHPSLPLYASPLLSTPRNAVFVPSPLTFDDPRAPTPPVLALPPEGLGLP